MAENTFNTFNLNTGNTNTTADYTGLDNGRYYEFVVSAINSQGSGIRSTPSAKTYIGGAPNAVRNLTGETGVASVSLSWNKPEYSGGKVITGYKVEKKLHDQTAPESPAALSGTAGNGEVILSWNPPTNFGFSDITGYKIEKADNANYDNWAQGLVVSTTTTNPYPVTGLTNGTNYKFRISTINGIGNSAASPRESVIVTPQAVPPGTPTILTAYSGNTIATLTWSAPSSDGGASITSYKVGYALGPSYNSWLSEQEIDTGATTTSYTFNGLLNDTAYKFRVFAKNIKGYGSPSTASEEIVPAIFSATNSPAGTYQIVSANGYKNHIFTGSGSLIVSGSKNVDFLIVAGGGAGGYKLGGGGGGGGVISGTNYPLSLNADLAIVVGGGAAGPTDSNTDAPDGEHSSIIGTGFNFKAYGGGGAGAYHQTIGKPGGSGGGHEGFEVRAATSAKYWQYNSSAFVAGDMPSNGQYTMSTSSGTVIAYGNKGGDCRGGWYPSGGGGAGQPGVGTDVSDPQIQTHGGDGIQVSWVTPQALGHSGSHNGVGNTTAYYWGGGGGANNHSNRSGGTPAGSGDGGKGGGGAGQRRYGNEGIEGVARSGGYADASLSNAPSSGPGGDGGTNTGGGGGGGDYNSTPHNGGSGGSGIVVIRYVSVSTVPAGLLNLQIENTGILEITASWTGPEDNGGPGTLYYRVEYAADPYSTWNSLTSGITSTSSTKSELTNGTNYKFRVYITNDTGESAAVVSSSKEAKSGFVKNGFYAYQNLNEGSSGFTGTTFSRSLDDNKKVKEVSFSSEGDFLRLTPDNYTYLNGIIKYNINGYSRLFISFDTHIKNVGLADAIFFTWGSTTTIADNQEWTENSNYGAYKLIFDFYNTDRVSLGWQDHNGDIGGTYLAQESLPNDQLQGWKTWSMEWKNNVITLWNSDTTFNSTTQKLQYTDISRTLDSNSYISWGGRTHFHKTLLGIKNMKVWTS